MMRCKGHWRSWRHGDGDGEKAAVAKAASQGVQGGFFGNIRGGPGCRRVSARDGGEGGWLGVFFGGQAQLMVLSSLPRCLSHSTQPMTAIGAAQSEQGDGMGACVPGTDQKQVMQHHGTPMGRDMMKEGQRARARNSIYPCRSNSVNPLARPLVFGWLGPYSIVSIRRRRSTPCPGHLGPGTRHRPSVPVPPYSGVQKLTTHHHSHLALALSLRTLHPSPSPASKSYTLYSP
ncbi:hypothetical protein EDB80DRAFT_678455 [Ilyonectria destructans]|nr:hypothetical protein EDB80DRAFT_678455 [Ilyonectria destructans]